MKIEIEVTRSDSVLDKLPPGSVIAVEGFSALAYYKQKDTLCWAPVGRSDPAYLHSRGILGGDGNPDRSVAILFVPTPRTP